jgi:hypothetical protein
LPGAEPGFAGTCAADEEADAHERAPMMLIPAPPIL